jgi:hypothetical protein
MANLTSAKTFRQYVAVEGSNHPSIHPLFVHAPPPGDAISPDSTPGFTATAVTDLLATAGHGLAADTPIEIVTSTAGGLAAAAIVYVISSGLTADAFKVSAAKGGSAVNVTSEGAGTWRRYLTDDERTEVETIRSRMLNGGSNFNPAPAAPVAVLTIAAWAAYDVNPVHLAWVIDDHLQRHWQWQWRSADHADAAATATPPSSTEDGIIVTPPPPSPVDRSPN